MPISELKQQPVKVGEEVVVDITDIHESGAGVGHTEDGFVVFVDGVLPEARARVKITHVKSNHARADELERLPLEPDEAEDDDESEELETESVPEDEEKVEEESTLRESPQQLGSRDNFWGG
jgi:predicted RNA-binding protein with TRAM domain